MGIGLEQTLIPGLALRGGSFSSSWGKGSGLEAEVNTWHRPLNRELSQDPFQLDPSHCVSPSHSPEALSREGQCPHLRVLQPQIHWGLLTGFILGK